jgi:cell division protein FtsZ
MSEIQEAAEIITSAVSPDANIIFGATLKPELEDELIITVIATGFDSEFFKQQNPSLLGSSGDVNAVEARGIDEEAVRGVDLNLDQSGAEENFAEETNHNIWDTQDDDESDTPAFLRRRKKNKQSDDESKED